MTRNSVWFALILTVALAMTSCNRKTIYHHYKQTPLTGWEKNDTLIFSVSPVKQRAVVMRNLELRISNDFPFQRLNLIVEQTVYPSSYRRSDTPNCQLIADEGTVKGGGVSLYEYRFQLPDISVNEDDSIDIRVRHNMKREILPGVSDVGIKLTAY